MKAFKNFINGEHVEAADGRTTEVVNPATGEEYATAPLSAQADVDAAMAAAATAYEEWRETTPSERSLALFRIADAVEARADELIALEVENSGKPIAPDPQRGDPADGRPDPLLRHGRPPPRGQERRRVHARHDLDHPPRADRRVRPGRAVELPDDDGGVEVRAGARRRQHRGAQAQRHHAGHHRHCSPRSPPSSCPPACST